MIHLLLLLNFCLVFSVGAQSAPKMLKDKAALSEFFKAKTKIENPLELRDPFKEPLLKMEGEPIKRKGYMVTGAGNYSNITDTVNYSSMNVNELKVVGVLIGKERRAMVLPNATAKNIVILKEGLKIGPDEAELKAILPGGIVLVEKILNVYGQEEYLETVIPISR